MNKLGNDCIVRKRKHSIWLLLLAPIAGALYYVTFDSAYLQSMNYVVVTPENETGYQNWIPTSELTWGSHWLYRLIAEGVSITGATFIAAGLNRHRARIGGLLGGVGIAMLAALVAFAIFVLGGKAATIEPWYQNAITASLIFVAPAIGWAMGDIAEEFSTISETGFAGIPRGHFIWLWIPFWFYGLALIGPVLNLWLYYYEADAPTSIITAIGGLIRAIPIIAYAIPLYFGLRLLAGAPIKQWPMVARQLLGIVILVGGYVAVAAIHILILPTIN